MRLISARSLPDSCYPIPGPLPCAKSRSSPLIKPVGVRARRTRRGRHLHCPAATLQRVNAQTPTTSSRLSVVIPVGPAEPCWRGLIDNLRALPPDVEIVLASPAVLNSIPPIHCRCAVVTGPPGRAEQLNQGIRAARGRWLWLLHADSRITEHDVTSALAWIGTARNEWIGWLTLRFADDGPALTRLNAWGANLRSRLLRLPFGDQGLLVSAALMRRVGGFDSEFGRGEDLEWIVRARRMGAKPAPVGANITTSARRYRNQGWLATTRSHLDLTWRLWRKARRQTATQPPEACQ